MIQEARAMRGLPFCDEVEQQVHLSAWGRVLADVPTDDLEESFTRAARGIGPELNVTPAHVARAYDEIKRERFYEKQQQERSQPAGIDTNAWMTPAQRAEWNEQHRTLSPEENAVEFAKWSAWLEEQAALRGQKPSASGMTALSGLLGQALKGGADDE